MRLEDLENKMEGMMEQNKGLQDELNKERKGYFMKFPMTLCEALHQGSEVDSDAGFEKVSVSEVKEQEERKED